MCKYFLQEKCETDKVDIEVEERKFEPSGSDRDLVDLLGKLYTCMLIIMGVTK